MKQVKIILFYHLAGVLFIPALQLMLFLQEGLTQEWGYRQFKILDVVISAVQNQQLAVGMSMVVQVIVNVSEVS
jgi:hypothetical protein